tara:strand:+ start:319 stop:531 length:213 start_codon:yes stop_codon:yes gene_type:complete
MYNNIETLIRHQGWARGSKVHYLIQKNMVEGKSKDEIQKLSLQNKIFRPRSFVETWRLFDKIKKDIKWVG